MAFTKVFGTTSGAYSTATLWKPIDISNPNWKWTASGSGTAEYYLTTLADGDPGFVAQPANVYLNGSNATEGTAGSLSAGQWDYADNDTLGFSTIYVRLSDGTDPDTKDPYYVKFYQIPQAGENVRFAADSASINSATGLDQRSVAIADFVTEKGYSGSIGSATLGPLYIDPDRVEINDGGELRLDIGSANISPQVYGTGAAADGEFGLYLTGSNIATLTIGGGTVGVAQQPGETSTVATIRVLGGFGHSVEIGSGVSLTTLQMYGGSALLRCAATTCLVYDGQLTTTGSGAITTVNQHEGTVVANSTGTVTTFNLYGGTLDLQQTGSARTITNLNKKRGNSQIKHNKEAVTVTNETRDDTFTETIGF